MEASGVDCGGPKKQEDSKQLQGVEAKMIESTRSCANLQPLEAEDDGKKKQKELEEKELEWEWEQAQLLDK